MNISIINEYNDHIEHLKSKLDLLIIDPSNYNVRNLQKIEVGLQQIRKESIYQELHNKFRAVYDSYTLELEEGIKNELLE